MKLSKCVYCGSEPVVIHYDSDMWYVECSNPNCTKHGKYAIFGFREKIAIDQWEYLNRPLDRTPPPRKERKNDKGIGKKKITGK